MADQHRDGLRRLDRVLIILAMAATLVAATALPQAFGNAAVVFGLAFGSVRVLHVGLLLLHACGDDDLRRAVLRLVPTLLTGPALVLMAAFVDSPYRELLWLIGAAVDFGGPVITGMAGWRVLPSYFVERHGQIIIIALGEAIVAVGAGAGDALARPGVLTAMVLGVLVSAALWWAYFGNIRTGAEQLMRSVRGVQRARLARDSYSYLHLALMAGIVYFALGVHETVAHPDQPLDLLPAVALCGGVALFFAGDVAYRWRDHHQLATDRLLAAVAALVVVPLALAMPALVALAVVAAVCAVWTGWEAWYHPPIGPVQARPPALHRPRATTGLPVRHALHRSHGGTGDPGVRRAPPDVSGSRYRSFVATWVVAVKRAGVQPGSESISNRRASAMAAGQLPVPPALSAPPRAAKVGSCPLQVGATCR